MIVLKHALCAGHYVPAVTYGIFKYNQVREVALHARALQAGHVVTAARVPQLMLAGCKDALLFEGHGHRQWSHR